MQGTNARKHAGNNPQLNHAGVWFTISLVPISGSVEALMGIVCRGNPLQGMVHDGEYKVPATFMETPLDSKGCVKAHGNAFDVTPFVGFPGPLPSLATYIQLQPQRSNS